MSLSFQKGRNQGDGETQFKQDPDYAKDAHFSQIMGSPHRKLSENQQCGCCHDEGGKP